MLQIVWQFIYTHILTFSDPFSNNSYRKLSLNTQKIKIDWLFTKRHKNAEVISSLCNNIFNIFIIKLNVCKTVIYNSFSFPLFVALQGFSFLTYTREWSRSKKLKHSRQLAQSKKPLKCPICHLVIEKNRMGNLNRHLKLHKPIQDVLICNLCNRSYQTPYNFDAHKNRHHKEVPKCFITWRKESRIALARPMYGQPWTIFNKNLFNYKQFVRVVD